jgi:hypothetical protein
MMDQIKLHDIDEATTLDKIGLARTLISLNDEQWRELGLFQRFHQDLFKTYLQFMYLSEDTSTMVCHKEDLIETLQLSLDQKLKTLFSLTASELIEELHSADWLNNTQGVIDIPLRRWHQLKDQLLSTEEGVIEIQQLRPKPSESELKAELTRKREEEKVAKRAERLKKSLEYIDPLKHILEANETPFTIRRLDQILTSLDGIVLRQDSFRDLLRMGLEEYQVIFDATDRLGLTHQSDDGYIRLDFHGTSIARQARPKRLKTLSMIASRLRREAKLKSQS